MKQNNIPWELIIAKFKQEISEEENAELTRWASASGHQAVLDDLETVWRKIQDKSSDYTPDKERYWQELSSRINRKTQTAKPTPAKKTFSFRYFYRYAAACIILVAMMGLSYYGGLTIHQKEHIEQTYTCMNGKSKISLPDGSKVWLHANTTLSYGADFQEENRLVKVSGEAYFEVAKDLKKEFIVQTDGMQVVVHGTKFNVAAFESEDKSRVSLSEGSVSLRTSSGNIFLKPGEIAVYDKKDNSLSLEDGDVAFDMLWTNDKFLIANEPLGDVCRLLSKWYDVDIHLEEGLENKYKYTFTLRNEPLEEIVRLMARITSISYSFDEYNVLTISSGGVRQAGTQKR